MDRVQTDKMRTPSPHIFNQNTEVSEITDPPVIPAAQAVQLNAGPPHLATINKRLLLETGLGRDDQPL